MPILRLSLPWAAALALVAPASAQVFSPPAALLPQTHDTGWASAQGDPTRRELVHQFTVTQTGADWVRLYFADVAFAGDVLAGNGAVLRLTAHLDGAVQLLDAITLEQWGSSSAYFNGDSVEVELLAYPGTGTSRVVMRALDAALPMPIFSQCGPNDDRLPSTDPRSARLLPVGCTGWMIDDCATCFLTAGHCQGNIQVVQFNVPPSNTNGSLNNPPPSDQYAVDASSLQGSGGGGVGNDWAYFGTFANSTTGLTPAQVQGQGFQLVNPPPVSGNDIRITGYGTDSTPSTRNQVQQTHVGPLVTSSGTTVQYQTDTTGGNSGSPVIWEQTGQAVGIHTHGGCNTSGGGQNSGTGMNHPGLQQALASPQGVCSGGLGNGDSPTLLAPGAPTQVTVSASGSIVAGTVTLHVRTSPTGMFASIPMTAASGGVYTADLPAFACGDSPAYFYSAQFTQCGLLTQPASGASAPFEAVVGLAQIVFADNFQTNLGWTTSSTATTGQWQRGVPVNDPGWAFDPSSDGDGSGAAFLTQNQFGNTDVDNGAVTLVSPRLDRSGAGDISYLYYLELTREGAEDALVVDVSDDDGASWVQFRRHDVSVNWASATITSTELAAAGLAATTDTRVRFIANDANTQSIVEAGVDGFAVSSISCDPTVLGASYCTATVNSSGMSASIRGNGSRRVQDNDVTLTAEAMPPNALGYFLVSPSQAFVPMAGGSSGNLCVGLPLGRYAGNVLDSGAGGTFALAIDLGAVPQPTGNASTAPGDTWNFQAWYRDSILGFPTSNLTNGVSITFD